MENESKVPEWKKKAVEELKNDIEKFDIISIVNLENLPNKQFQQIRKKLKNKIEIKVKKKAILLRALEVCSKKRVKELAKQLTGVPALLLSNINAFELFQLLKQNQSPAPAKAGQIVPEDIWINAGLTPFIPGPVISDLQKLGLKTGVENGKITIKEDKMVIKKGGEVPGEAVSILARLGIEPMKIGINLIATLENGDILSQEVLDINIEEYIDNIKSVHSDALKLSIELGIINPDTIQFLLRKAAKEVKTIADSQNILTKDTAGKIISKIENQAAALQGLIKGSE